jgi:hypothetical protein
LTEADRRPTFAVDDRRAACRRPPLSRTLRLCGRFRARGSYVERRGFALESAHGEPTHFGLLRRGGARLALREVRQPVFVDNIRAREQLLSLILTFGDGADVDTLHADLAMHRTVVFQPPRTEPWAARTTIILDPDGNLILLAGPAEERA